MKKPKLDTYEQNIEDNLFLKEEISTKEKEKSIRKLKIAADEYTKKDKRITIRIYNKDLMKIKFIAIKKGMPYQTLISSIIHQYSLGKYSNG